MSCLAVATVALINSSVLDVNEVIVVGAEKANPALIIEASEISPGQSLLEVDSGDSAALVERVSWVGTAEVRRSLSGKVEIAIAEREPLVALPAGSGFALVDHWGRQLEVVDRRPENYLPVSGVRASGQAGEMAPPETALLLMYLNSSSPTVNANVQSIRLTADEIEATLVSGGTVNFGDGELMSQKVQALETLLKRVDLACLAEIDLHVPSAPALKRLPSTASQATTEGGPGEDPKLAAPNC